MTAGDSVVRWERRRDLRDCWVVIYFGDLTWRDWASYYLARWRTWRAQHRRRRAARGQVS